MNHQLSVVQNSICYILAGMALFGMLLTLLVPRSRAGHKVIPVIADPAPVQRAAETS